MPVRTIFNGLAARVRGAERLALLEAAPEVGNTAEPGGWIMIGVVSTTGTLAKLLIEIIFVNDTGRFVEA
jgi:hypothetical protein